MSFESARNCMVVEVLAHDHVMQYLIFAARVNRDSLNYLGRRCTILFDDVLLTPAERLWMHDELYALFRTLDALVGAHESQT